MDLLKEFRDEFEFLYQSASHTAPDINSYEISLLLTKAVDKIISDSIPLVDTNESSRRLLQPLIVPDVTCIKEDLVSEYKYYNKLKYYYPEDSRYNLKVGIITGSCSGALSVVTDKVDFLSETINNPFRRPNKRKVLRVIGGSDSKGQFDYIYYNKEIEVDNITVTYIKDNNPIIVSDFKTDPSCIGDESIKGKDTLTNTELSVEFYPMILEIAVGFAKLTIKK